MWQEILSINDNVQANVQSVQITTETPGFQQQSQTILRDHFKMDPVLGHSTKQDFQISIKSYSKYCNWQ